MHRERYVDLGLEPAESAQGCNSDDERAASFEARATSLCSVCNRMLARRRLSKLGT